MKKIYKTRPFNYRQWRQIRKEIYELALVILFCVLIGYAAELYTHYVSMGLWR